MAIFFRKVSDLRSATMLHKDIKTIRRRLSAGRTGDVSRRDNAIRTAASIIFRALATRTADAAQNDEQTAD